jgi:hypothetical protein
MKSNPSNPRTAGLLYLSLMATGGYSMLYVPSLIVPGDPAATAENILAHEALYRLGIVSGLACQVIFLLLVLALYKLFREVNRTHAALMVGLVVAAVPVGFLNMLNQVAALHVLSGADYLRVFEADQLNALMMLFLELHGQGLLIVQVFWGAWLLPLGLLVMKAPSMPTFIGVLLIVACGGYLVDVLTRLLIPEHAAIVSSISGAAKFGELAMALWLLSPALRTRPVHG